MKFVSPVAWAAALTSSQVQTASRPDVHRRTVVRPGKRQLPFSSEFALRARLSPRLTELTWITVHVGHHKFPI
jgi:hypothetical protein